MRHSVLRFSWLASVAVLAGCFQPISEDSGLGGSPVPGCPGCHRTTGGITGVGGGSGNGGMTTKKGTSGGSSSGGRGSSSGGAGGSSGGTPGGSSSGGSSSGGAAGGSSSGGVLVCPAGTYVAASSVSNFGAVGGGGQPVPGATVSEIGRNGVTLSGVGTSAVTDMSGNFQLCVPLETPLTLEIQASMYPTTYIEELDVTSDAGPSTLLQKGLQLIASSELSALKVFLTSGPPLNLNDGMIFSGVLSISQQLPCSDAAGWTVGVEFLDGGALSDGGPLPYQVAYLNKSDLPANGATVTSSNGYAIVYNVDPTIASVAQLVATNIDGGMPCPPENASEMVTGRVTIGNGSITFAPYFVP